MLDKQKLDDQQRIIGVLTKYLPMRLSRPYTAKCGDSESDTSRFPVRKVGAGLRSAAVPEWFAPSRTSTTTVRAACARPS